MRECSNVSCSKDLDEAGCFFSGRLFHLSSSKGIIYLFCLFICSFTSRCALVSNKYVERSEVVSNIVGNCEGV